MRRQLTKSSVKGEPPGEAAQDPAPVDQTTRAVDPKEGGGVIPKEKIGSPNDPVTENPADTAHFQELLAQLGDLRLPENGVLSPQWREFLKRLRRDCG